LKIGKQIFIISFFQTSKVQLKNLTKTKPNLDSPTRLSCMAHMVFFLLRQSTKFHATMLIAVSIPKMQRYERFAISKLVVKELQFLSMEMEFINGQYILCVFSLDF
jgi:hypothetical protein